MRRIPAVLGFLRPDEVFEFSFFCAIIVGLGLAQGLGLHPFWIKTECLHHLRGLHGVQMKAFFGCVCIELEQEWYHIRH